ncbi:hypothetical protein MJO28_000368 [Puccinia striiformis f. sp. tritici]|uniref:Uncharacterized protein n=1 Tax=Puccinia striiformis f. sp. tritici TaxID=168172 RepID=A0ACC0EYX8_9BASI|nr:hypothetical protein MJO28_000368 [Puccinia striiformis f. sp. tritici]
MSNSENPIQPLFTSTSSVSIGGTDRPAALVSLNLPAVQQALNLSTSIDFDSRSPAPSSLTTTSPEQPPTREKKSYIATNHPNSHSTHVCLGRTDGMPRQSHYEIAPQISFSNSSKHQDPPEPNRSENCASKEEAVFSKRADRNSLYFPPGASLLKSPGAGISSSVGVPAAECTTENATHSESFINFTGLTSKMTAHRRVSPSHTGAYSANPNGKPSLAPISIIDPHLEWAERHTEKRNVSSFPGRNFVTSLLRILPLSFTSSASSYNERISSPQPERRYPGNNPFWSIITFIPRLIIRFLQYLVSPWTGWLSLPEFLSRNNSFGDAPKLRRKGLASSIATIYVIFCMFIFSHDVSTKAGLIGRDKSIYQGDKGEVIPRSSDVVPWRNLLSVFSPFESNSQTTPIGYEKYLTNISNSPISSSTFFKNALIITVDNSSASAASGIQTPLSSMTHTARLSKLHSKSGFRFSEAFTPLLFQGTHIFPAESITACLYSNQFWLDRVPDFVRSWDGPVSLVVESFSTDRPKLITRIQEMRKNIPSIRKSVDFHIVLVPDGSSTQKLKNAQRMMAEPIATNAQLNVARFFSRSELVWLAGDARVLPSTGLYDVLTKQTNLRTRVLDYGNAIVIPSFAFSRAKQVNPNTFQWTGEEADLNQMAQQYINESILSIALPSHKWPSTREDLLRLTTQSDSPKPDMSAMAMYDQAWKPSEGPTNWTMWQTFVPKLDSGASRIMDSAKTLQGDLSGVQDQMYPVVSYDLNYAPNVIVSREGQPWCTERFEYNKAACVYQMYLAGTELWVMPEAWSLTFQQMPSTSKRFDEDRELKELISARLYSKFHQEACMHYGREFSSLGTWGEDRSKHARAVCLHVLSSWGVGISSEDLMA